MLAKQRENESIAIQQAYKECRFLCEGCQTFTSLGQPYKNAKNWGTERSKPNPLNRLQSSFLSKHSSKFNSEVACLGQRLQYKIILAKATTNESNSCLLTLTYITP